MWLSKLILVCVVTLAACGFTPAYAPGGSGGVLQNTVLAAEPRNKAAFDLVERLEERLGPSDNPKYALTYTIATSLVGLGITADNATTRYNLLGTVDWELTDVMTRARLTGGKAENFTAFSATSSAVGGLAVREDAAQRLMRILADQIVSQLLATSGSWAGTTAP